MPYCTDPYCYRALTHEDRLEGADSYGRCDDIDCDTEGPLCYKCHTRHQQTHEATQAEEKESNGRSLF